jgi:hypothetical protein
VPVREARWASSSDSGAVAPLGSSSTEVSSSSMSAAMARPIEMPTEVQ